MTTVYVSSFNHRSLDGVAEIAELLTSEFKRIGLNAVSCRDLPAAATPGDVLVLVDEFSEPLVLDALRRYRKMHPGLKMVCILTEFFTPATNARPPGLNTFKHPRQSVLLDNLLYLYCHLNGHLKLFPENGIRAPGLLNYALGLAGGFWLLLAKLRRPWLPVRKLRVFHERAYLWFRGVGLCSVQGLFDRFLALHPAIATPEFAAVLGTRAEDIGTLLIPPPQVNKEDLIDAGLEFGLDMSGTLNHFRRQQVDAVVRILRRLSPGGRFSARKERGFDDSGKKLLLSFNTPQSPTWCYSSPMRIIGAIKRGQIPVVSQKFGDHPAEDLALVFTLDPEELRNQVNHLIFERSRYIDEAWEALQRYNRLADQNNGAIIRRLLGEDADGAAGARNNQAA